MSSPTKPRAPRASRWRKALAGAGLALLLGAAGWATVRAKAGDPRAHLADRWHEGHRLVDRHGELLRELPSELGARGRPLPLEELGERIVTATLVSEDARFYDHGGIDALAIARAMSQNVRHRRVVSGASTITQQLVKLLDTEGRPTRSDRSLSTKLWEAARAQNLERTVDKRAILGAYLNRLDYGRGLLGPEAAAQAYFGVPSAELSWAQAALLAVLPRAPSYLDPIRHPERGRLRQRALLDALRDAGHLANEEHAAALAEPVEVHTPRPAARARHLADALRGGALGSLSAGAVTRLTLDGALQRELEGLTESGASVLVVDNHTGEVLAYVGRAHLLAAHDEPTNDARAREGEATLLELTAAFVALARDGVTIPLRFVTPVGVEPGTTPGPGRRVMPAAQAAAAAEALRDPRRRARGPRGAGCFDVGFPLAVKTASGADCDDPWAVGFTKEHTVAVWTGSPAPGAPGAGTLLVDTMRRAMRHAPGREGGGPALAERAEPADASAAPAPAPRPPETAGAPTPGPDAATPTSKPHAPGHDATRVSGPSA